MKKIALIITILLTVTVFGQYERKFDVDMELSEFIISVEDNNRAEWEEAFDNKTPYVVLQYVSVFKDTVTMVRCIKGEVSHEKNRVIYKDGALELNVKFKNVVQTSYVGYSGMINKRVYTLAKGGEYSELTVFSEWRDFRVVYSQAILKKGNNYEQHNFY